MARLIGDAYIVIYPQTDLFGPRTAAAVDKALKALKPSVAVQPTVSKAAAAKVKTELNELGSKVDVTPALAPGSVAKIEAQLNALHTNLTAGVKIDPAQLAAAKASLAAFSKGIETANIGVAMDPVKLAAAKAQMDAFMASGLKMADIGVRLSPAQLAAAKASLGEYLKDVDLGFRIDPQQLAAARASLSAFTKGVEAVNIGVRMDPVKLAAAKASIDGFIRTETAAEVTLPVQVNSAPAKTRLDELAARTSVLATQLMNLRANVEDTGAEAKIAALQVKAEAFAKALAAANSAADFGPFEAQLLGMEAGYGKLIAAQTAEDTELGKQLTFWNKLGLSGPGALVSLHEMLNTTIPGVRLFGGALDMMYAAVRGGDAKMPTAISHLVAMATSGHLTAEAGIEIAAVWVPATLALTAFGLAATPTAIEIGKQLQNMRTASLGTGKAFDSLATSGSGVVAAVRPTVLEAFGIALFAVQNHSSDLAGVLHTLGQGIDQLAAKAAIAFDSSTSDKFFKSGSADALALMDSFQQLGSILGTLFKAVPGYAEVLLNFGNALLSVAATGTKFAEPFIAQFLKLHGALLYGGLTGTAASWVFPKIISAASNAALGVGMAAEKILGSESKIVSGATGLGASLQGLSSGPIIAGVGLLVGAIAAVAIYLKASSNAASDFSKTIQSTLKNTAVTALPQALANDLAQANAKVADSQTQYTQAVNQTTEANKNLAAAGRGGAAQLLNNDAALQKVQATLGTYSRGQQQLSQQSQNLNLNLGAIAGTFGTTIPGALSLASAAQVTSNQLLAKGGDNWAVISTMIAGYIAQLKVMVPGTGALNQALNVLNVTESQQVQNAQKLGQAYQAWLGIVTGGDSAFTSFEQGMATLSDTLGQKTIPTAVTSTTATTQATQSITKLGGTSTTTSQSLTKLASGGKDVTTSLSKTAKGGQDVTNSLRTTTSATTKAGGAADTLSVRVGNLTEKFSTVGASMNGVTPAALAARQAFDQQVTSAATLYANLQTMSVVSGSTAASQNELAHAGRDLVAQLLPMAAGSKTATAEVFALAQIAGYNGVDSFTKLAQWAGNTKLAEGDLNHQTEVLTVSSANLTQAAKDLSAAMQNEVAAGESAAIAKATNLTDIQGKLATAVENGNGKFTQSAITLAGQYYEALIKSGQGADTARQDVDAFLTKLGATPDTVNTVNQALAKLPKSVSTSVQVSVSGVGEIKALVNDGLTLGQATKHAEADLLFSAAGGTVTGKGPAGRDSVPAMLAPGELVIPTSHAPKFADAARKASIPGFAGGGSVPGLDAMTSSLTTLTPFAASAETSFTARAGQEFVTAAIAEAKATAQAAAAQAINAVGVSNASAQLALQSAAAKLGWTGAEWTALNNVEMREAGYSLTAQNPISRAYGMAQFINGPAEYAQYGGNSTTAAGQATAMVNYIRQRYGDPINAWAHELQFGWYNQGGPVKPHSAGGMVSEPVFGRGMFTGMPYSFAENGPEYVGPISGTSQGPAPLTAQQAGTLIDLMKQQNKMLAQLPYSFGQALNQSNAAGVRRGYFATAG